MSPTVKLHRLRTKSQSPELTSRRSNLPVTGALSSTRRSPPGGDPPALVINYPRTGKRVLPVGTTVIYIKQKKVRLPGGTTEGMYATRSVNACRCFAMYVDHMVDIRISQHGSLVLTSSVFPAWFRKLDMLEFDTVEIECTEPTTFYIAMSEKPDGVPEHHPERWLSPAVSLGYNAGDDLVEMKKVVNGVTLTRLIDDPSIADVVVVKWVEYGAWQAV